MTLLVRLDEWIFDKDNIEFVQINPADSKAKNEQDPHNVEVQLKDKQHYILKCDNHWTAIDVLNELTSQINPIIGRNGHNQYLCRAINRLNSNFYDLEREVRNVIRELKKKNKGTKNV